MGVREIFKDRSYGAVSVRLIRIRVTVSRTAAHRVVQRAHGLLFAADGLSIRRSAG
jgi:hypothetical protein